MMQKKSVMTSSSWKQKELLFLVLYAVVFYALVIRRSLQLSHDHYAKLYGLRPGWIFARRNDASDAQWRNFRENLPILTIVFGIFTLVANLLQRSFSLRAKGMSLSWIVISLAYLFYLHGACILFIFAIALANFFLVKIFGRTKYFLYVLWIFNLSFLVCNRIYGGYRFSSFGERWAYLDEQRGIFRWHICFNFVVLRMISFGTDYHWTDQYSNFDHKKHIQRCDHCSTGKTCYLVLQERRVTNDKFSFAIYFCYLVYAPLYLSGPIISFNAFASQFFYYNAFAISGLWKQLSPVDIFIIGYGVLNFMWLKFFLIWRYFRFWSVINGIVPPENMPRCVNNCHNLESFWKNWHASFNKWLVRYVYIPLGGSQKKLLNVWVVFTFVAVWHDLEWKLLSWAWLTCIFFIPEMLVKSAANAFQAESAFGEFIFRELSAIAGAVTITCLMVANLVGFVIGPSGINWLVSGFLQEGGVLTLGGLLFTFYVGTKLMFHISDAKQMKDKTQ